MTYPTYHPTFGDRLDTFTGRPIGGPSNPYFAVRLHEPGPDADVVALIEYDAQVALDLAEHLTRQSQRPHYVVDEAGRLLPDPVRRCACRWTDDETCDDVAVAYAFDAVDDDVFALCADHARQLGYTFAGYVVRAT